MKSVKIDHNWMILGAKLSFSRKIFFLKQIKFTIVIDKELVPIAPKTPAKWILIRNLFLRKIIICYLSLFSI